MIQKSKDILFEKIKGNKRTTNYLWINFLFIGASGFLITSISSYLHINLVNFLNASDIIFFPQGLVMFLYSFLGINFVIYVSLLVHNEVGNGFNELNKKTRLLRIFRKKNKKSKIDICYPLKNIEMIKICTKDDFVTKKNIFIVLKDKTSIPINEIGKYFSIKEIEQKATKIASFLQVSMFEI